MNPETILHETRIVRAQLQVLAECKTDAARMTALARAFAALEKIEEEALGDTLVLEGAQHA